VAVITVTPFPAPGITKGRRPRQQDKPGAVMPQLPYGIFRRQPQ